jgi:hypothetical protein
MSRHSDQSGDSVRCRLGCTTHSQSERNDNTLNTVNTLRYLHGYARVYPELSQFRVFRRARRLLRHHAFVGITGILGAPHMLLQVVLILAS